MELIFVLVSPARPANVGAVARAMKTQGFAQLRIVDSVAHQDPEAGWVAHGAEELLAEASCFASADLALSDCDFVIATTARRRGCARDYWSPQQTLQQLESKATAIQRVALLFGCEESGLPNTLIDRADLLSCIPLAQPYPSLNLGQAAMVYAYALSPLKTLLSGAGQGRDDLTDSGEWQALKQRVATLQESLLNSEDQKLSEWLHDRLGLVEGRDIRMLHTLLNDIEKALL
ncbi:tRNA/rRNA methyltransferase [Corallincola spongiicola]|uniref:tRNA/rRNA methyltransferase n=1 Tax=Corallincola spongiicola TaxID=2520508 RepID=A0ABY1WRD1_9GAMM|nr:tRNA/rRNA methyltransferase [Corallincola spongiicola]TAA47297.1 tRNA/rRNA methyltransferase [Corallincola spongiicola]